MKIINDSSRHENGNRIVTQTLIYNLSDDIITLAQLQNQLGHNIRRTEEIQAGDNNDNATKELERLSTEREKINADIIVQQSYIDGYEAI